MLRKLLNNKSHQSTRKFKSLALKLDLKSDLSTDQSTDPITDPRSGKISSHRDPNKLKSLSLSNSQSTELLTTIITITILFRLLLCPWLPQFQLLPNNKLFAAMEPIATEPAAAVLVLVRAAARVHQLLTTEKSQASFTLTVT